MRLYRYFQVQQFKNASWSATPARTYASTERARESCCCSHTWRTICIQWPDGSPEVCGLSRQNMAVSRCHCVSTRPVWYVVLACCQNGEPTLAEYGTCATGVTSSALRSTIGRT